MVGAPQPGAEAARAAQFVGVDLPVLAALLIALSAVLSLVTIMAIYREGGILKRLRATPLRPLTILTAHVLVKLLLTAVTLVLMVLAGRRYYPVPVAVPVSSFMLALLFTTVSVLSLGFLIASLVPTARFAQPIGSAILYPMLALSGLFVPVDALPPGFRIIARLLPLTYASSLLEGDLDRRPVVRPRAGRRGPAAHVRRVHAAVREGVPLGMTNGQLEDNFGRQLNHARVACAS